MKKFLLSLAAVCTLLIFNAACALAADFGPGQRTIELLGGALNSDKHPVHLVVQQTIDMKDVLEPDAYAKLTTAQKVRYIRTEYNEMNGINAERSVTTDGEGKVLRDYCTFAKGGRWYFIDYVNKTYDELPELPGMSLPFAETLVSWFNERPQSGRSLTGEDYDMMTQGERVMYFYFAKGTADWLGYEVNTLPRFNVVEMSGTVDAETAFALPTADFTRQANEQMRSYAAKLMQNR